MCLFVQVSVCPFTGYKLRVCVCVLHNTHDVIIAITGPPTLLLIMYALE